MRAGNEKAAGVQAPTTPPPLKQMSLNSDSLYHQR
ncbi:hypothetical protein ABIA23_003697 [Sinorhizobium fredii]